jgi:hypothetical protein
MEVSPFAIQRAIRTERPPTSYREEGDLQRRIAQLEGSILKWRRKKTPSEASP